MLVEVIPILQCNFCVLPNTLHYDGRVNPVLQCNLCVLPNTSHYVGQGHPHLTEQPLYVSQQFPLCWSRVSPPYTTTLVCVPTRPIMFVELIHILNSNLCKFSSTSNYDGRAYPRLTEQSLFVVQHSPLCWSR